MRHMPAVSDRAFAFFIPPPAGHVVATPYGRVVSESARSTASCENQRSVIRCDLQQAIIRSFCHELKVQGSSPQTNIVPLALALAWMFVQCHLPPIIRQRVFVVVVPHGVDSLTLQHLDSTRPPVESCLGNEIYVGAIPTFASTSTPQLHDAFFTRTRIFKECIRILEAFVVWMR